MRQQHHLRLTLEAGLDIACRLVAEDLAGQVLRRVQQGSCRRRDHRSDISAGPNGLLDHGADGLRVDRGNDQRAAVRAHELPHLLHHHDGIVVRLIDLVGQPTVPGCQLQTPGDALHELPPVVLRESQRLAKTGRSRTSRSVRIERWKHHRPGNARRPLLRHSGISHCRRQRDHDRQNSQASTRTVFLHIVCRHPISTGDGKARRATVPG
jgi:hypothetical protein